jgi:hypothetical protein
MTTSTVEHRIVALLSDEAEWRSLAPVYTHGQLAHIGIP